MEKKNNEIKNNIIYNNNLIFLSSANSLNAEHNEEFPTNGCETPDKSIQISVNGFDLIYIIDGVQNPDVQVEKNSCLEITFENKTDGIDHDFTVVDESEADMSEIIHMDTPTGTTTHHLWLIPDKVITLDYFCEVPGHRAAGETGKYIIGVGTPIETDTTSNADFITDDDVTDTDGGVSLPGFELAMTISGLFLIFSIRKLRKNN